MKVSFTRSWTSTEKFALGYEKKIFFITMIALVFLIQKHSLQWRGEFNLYFRLVPEFLLVNSAARRCFMAAGFGKFLCSFLYLLIRSLTKFGSAGIWPVYLCPASQWKCWKSDIRSSIFNKTVHSWSPWNNVYFYAVFVLIVILT